MSADLLRESLAILRSYAKVFMDGVDKRFMNSGVTDDAVHVFALEYIPKSAAQVEPRAALNRLAIFFRTDYQALHSSWEHLQAAKEEVVLKRLEDHVLSGTTRADLKPVEVWAEVLTRMSENAMEIQKAAPASNVLEYFLLTNPTNAAVERDASTARLVHECTSNGAEADLLDSRMRIKIEGPPTSKIVSEVKGGVREHHPLIREAAKEFMLGARLLHGTSAGKVLGPMSAEQKGKLSALGKRKRVGSVESLALDVQLGTGSKSSKDGADGAADGPVACPGDIDDFVAGLDAADFGSAGPPPAKAQRGRGRGRQAGRGRGPKAAELARVVDVAGEDVMEEEPLFEESDAGESE